MATTSANSAGTQTSVRVLLGWQLAILAVLVALPLVILERLPWALPQREILPFVALLAAFAASAVVQWVITRLPSSLNRFVLTALTVAAVFGVVFLLLLVTQRAASRKLLLSAFFISLVMLPMPMLERRLRLISYAGAGTVLLFLSGFAVSKVVRDRHVVKPHTEESYVATTFYNLRILSHVGKVPVPAVRGGGLAAIDVAGSGRGGGASRALLATGDGHLYIVDPAPRALTVQPIRQRVPLNGEEFAAAFGRPYRPLKGIDRSAEEEAWAGVQTWRFRVADVLVQPLPGRIRIFASHHYWKPAEACVVVRVSSLELPVENLPTVDERTGWRTVFESTPCLTLAGKASKRSKNPFQGEETGGRLALLNEHTLLLTLGDLGYSGLDSEQVLAQDPGASYGKSLRIDLDTGASEVFTLGHRNPQGLYVAADGTIWSTEHAAKGGDELNVLRAGANYGWPRVTYGVDYGSFIWPLSDHQGHHDGYAEPAYAWLPSIGVSNVIAITRSAKFPVWRGDLLAGSLTGRSLFRIGVRGERVVFVEPILVNERVRDVLELDDGRLLIWADAAKLLEIAPATGMTAEVSYGARCGGCHTNFDGTYHRIGPDLHGLMDRGIAEAEGFEYSPALTRVRGDWTPEKLDAFLAAPQAFAPGTTMEFAGIEDARERRLLIEHLRKVTE